MKLGCIPQSERVALYITPRKISSKILSEFYTNFIFRFGEKLGDLHKDRDTVVGLVMADGGNA